MRAHPRPAHVGSGGCGRVRGSTGGVAGAAIGRHCVIAPAPQARSPRSGCSQHRAACIRAAVGRSSDSWARRRRLLLARRFPDRSSADGGFVPNHRCGAVPDWPRRRHRLPVLIRRLGDDGTDWPKIVGWSGGVNAKCCEDVAGPMVTAFRARQAPDAASGMRIGLRDASPARPVHAIRTPSGGGWCGTRRRCSAGPGV